MGKTFRCKNYEDQQGTSWDRRGRKTSGFYTVDVYHEGGFYSYRAPSKQEKAQEFWKIHGESRSANSRSPGKTHRKPRVREWRQQARREIHKFMTREDYDVVLDANPINCWWDWS